MTEQQCLILGSVLSKDLSGEECQILDSLGTLRDLKDGEVLIEEGKVDNCLHVLVSGTLAVTRQMAGGEPMLLHMLHGGELAGELGFIDGQEHTATLRATGPAAVFSLERGRFESLLETHPMLVYRLMRAIIRGVHKTLRRLNMQQMELSNYITHEHGRY